MRQRIDAMEGVCRCALAVSQCMSVLHRPHRKARKGPKRRASVRGQRRWHGSRGMPIINALAKNHFGQTETDGPKYEPDGVNGQQSRCDKTKSRPGCALTRLLELGLDQVRFGISNSFGIKSLFFILRFCFHVCTALPCILSICAVAQRILPVTARILACRCVGWRGW